MFDLCYFFLLQFIRLDVKAKTDNLLLLLHDRCLYALCLAIDIYCPFERSKSRVRPFSPSAQGSKSKVFLKSRATILENFLQFQKRLGVSLSLENRFSANSLKQQKIYLLEFVFQIDFNWHDFVAEAILLQRDKLANLILV